MREIRLLRAMWWVLETELRKLLTGHEDGNVGYRQGVSCGLPRQHSTLPFIAPWNGSMKLIKAAPLSPKCAFSGVFP